MQPEYQRDSEGRLWFVEPDRDAMRISYRVREIVSSCDTPYQNLTILDLYDYGRTLVLDGAIQTTELDAGIYNEMLVHVPVVIHGRVRRVLVIGAGACGNIRELVKYPAIEQIDVVEIDPAVVEVCCREMACVAGTAAADRRVAFHYMDGCSYVREAAHRGEYDLVLIDSSDPCGPSVGLYSRDFYAYVHDVLGEEGVVVCQSESPLFYREVGQQIYSDLEGLFPVVEPYSFPMPCFPGGVWSLTLASKRNGPADADPGLMSGDVRFIQKDKLACYFSLPAAILEGSC